MVHGKWRVADCGDGTDWRVEMEEEVGNGRGEVWERCGEVVIKF